MMPKLIVMLTQNDRTVPNARALFDACRAYPVQYWGCKEEGLPRSELKALFREMKQCGKHTVLEVVAYDEAAGRSGAELAAECGAETVMGTCFSPAVRDFCKAAGMRYMPFVGDVRERPSILTGEPEAIIAEAQRNIENGADGVDLLGYRYQGDAEALNRRLVQAVAAPVCIAGSIDSYARLDAVLGIQPWGFTIGSALFEGCFGESFPAQIAALCAYLDRKAGVQHDRAALSV